MGNAATNLGLLPNRQLRTTTPDSESGDLDQVMLMTLCDYPPADICEPIFRVGERLRLVSEEGYRWKVCSLLTKEENYIPQCHVAKVYHGWLFEGVSRVQAEQLLFLRGNRVGSFLIRESSAGTYSLSIKHRAVKHYRINRLPNNWYYISPRLTFQCLEDLVNHYSDAADGLCCVLTGPCLGSSDCGWTQLNSAPPVDSPHSFDWRCVNSSELLQDEARAASPGEPDSMLSYGVQSSVSSYLSLAAGAQETKRYSWKRRRGRSVYVLQQSHLRNRLAVEEDSYESVP
ncbi:src-like-adapter [Clupea harengus]|uniref:Src-like-adapter n=1 Tax=Clupea harengus TaxID=7950 RepID=A0A6P8G2W4_CLUHA|nr:src-like-adapter [Clupea harengus]